MPELPEVETIVRELKEAHLIGFKIERAVVFWDRSIAKLRSASFSERIVIKRFLILQDGVSF